MASHTIKVTGVSDELLQLLDERIRAQHSTGRAEYIRELIRQDVLGAKQAPAPRKSFREILSPVHEATRQQGITEAEMDQDIEDIIQAVRAERRAEGNHQ